MNAGPEVALLQRLVTSPFTRRRFWDERPRIALVAGAAAWVIRDKGILPADDAPVDATITCTAADLSAMASGVAPPGPVVYTLGTRDHAPRRKQARALLALAALGWCGPWPDPAADPEHVRLVRAAHYDLGIGPADGAARLFAEGGPLPHVTVRLTHGVRGVELVTEGLADTVGLPEVATLAPGRTDPRLAFPVLRAAALYAAEHSGLPTRLPLPAGALPAGALGTRPHPAFADGLALPNQRTWLVQVTHTA